MSEENNSSDFSHSLTDLMTSLAIVFLILAVAMISLIIVKESDNSKKYQKLQNEFGKTAKIKADILNEIKELFRLKTFGNGFISDDNCVLVDASDDYRIKIKFNGDDQNCADKNLMYPSGEYKKDKIKVLDSLINISKIYLKVCDKNSLSFLENIQVLGRTDATKLLDKSSDCSKYYEDMQKIDSGELQCGNIALSANRARDVYLLVGSYIMDNEKDVFECFKNKTEISGRGPFGEFEKNIDSDHMRRIELVINFRKPI